MKKSIIILVSIIIIASLAYTFTRNDDALENLPPPNQITAREVKGTVVSVNTDAVALDGPSLITIKDESGADVVVAVPSMGINLCLAKDAIADVYTIKAGDVAEARGTVDEEGRIVPCESSDHYLKITSSTTQKPSTVSGGDVQTPSTPPVSSEPAVPTVKSYTLAEISMHNSKTSCWTTIEGKVYGITPYVPRHPGGEQNILKICGKDGSSLFEGQHGGDNKPNKMLATFYIGELK